MSIFEEFIQVHEEVAEEALKHVIDDTVEELTGGSGESNESED